MIADYTGIHRATYLGDGTSCKNSITNLTRIVITILYNVLDLNLALFQFLP